VTTPVFVLGSDADTLALIRYGLAEYEVLDGRDVEEAIVTCQRRRVRLIVVDLEPKLAIKRAAQLQSHDAALQVLFLTAEQVGHWRLVHRYELQTLVPDSFDVISRPVFFSILRDEVFERLQLAG
jgi:hypothetical protein